MTAAGLLPPSPAPSRAMTTAAPSRTPSPATITAAPPRTPNPPTTMAAIAAAVTTTAMDDA